MPVRVVVVMGVAGAGKSRVGRALAERLGWSFLDADDLHPADNVAKMREGVALTDEDRWPWLDRVAAWVTERVASAEPAVVACSALKRSYRDRLAAADGVVFVQLEADADTLRRRLRERRDHYMQADLLDSQLAALEPPAADEPAIIVDGTLGPTTVLREVLAGLSAMPEFTHDG